MVNFKIVTNNMKMARILIVNNAEPEIKEFANSIENIVIEFGGHPIVIEYKDCMNFDFGTIAGVILTGSPQGDDIIEHHQPYYQWVKTVEKPILGICAGHHIIGFMFGSEIIRGEEPESGDFVIEILKGDLIFNGFTTTFKVKQMHNDSISLPAEFELLATSPTCNNQLMKHSEKLIYTCQFHPEYYNHKIIGNFIKLCQ